MADIGQLQSNTLQAAQKALDAGLISKPDFGRITDGTVSIYDVSQARNLVAANAGAEGTVADIAREFASAVTQQNQAQGSISSTGEMLKDFFTSPVAQKEVSKDVYRNFKKD